MSTTVNHTDTTDEFLASATGALAADPVGGLDALGWWDLLADLDDVDCRTAVLTAFRAQGRSLAGTAALGGLLAQPLLAGTDAAPATAIAAIRRERSGRDAAWTLLGDPGGRVLLFDEPGRGRHLLDPTEVDLRPVEVPGRLAVHDVAVDLAGRSPDAAEPTDEARAVSLRLGRLAAAGEQLGAAEIAVGLAVEHAAAREQFGKPIGTFQAVRHLLSWARTDVEAVAATLGLALACFDDPPPRQDEAVKALAGRNGRRACQHSLQVLGGIGFTAEHPHHHHYGRVLLLDGVLGSSAALARGLGAWLRTERTDPGYPAAALGL